MKQNDLRALMIGHEHMIAFSAQTQFRGLSVTLWHTLPTPNLFLINSVLKQIIDAFKLNPVPERWRVNPDYNQDTLKRLSYTGKQHTWSGNQSHAYGV